MCWCLVLLCCVSTNCTKLLGRVDQVLQEDSEYLLREQRGFRNQGEYTYNGWFRIVIVFMNSLVNLLKYYLQFFMEYMWILYCNQLVEAI